MQFLLEPSELLSEYLMKFQDMDMLNKESSQFFALKINFFTEHAQV